MIWTPKKGNTYVSNRFYRRQIYLLLFYKAVLSFCAAVCFLAQCAQDCGMVAPYHKTIDGQQLCSYNIFKRGKWRVVFVSITFVSWSNCTNTGRSLSTSRASADTSDRSKRSEWRDGVAALGARSTQVRLVLAMTSSWLSLNLRVWSLKLFLLD